jgi:hypothetical protein
MQRPGAPDGTHSTLVGRESQDRGQHPAQAATSQCRAVCVERARKEEAASV